MLIHVQSDTHTEFGVAAGQSCSSHVTVCAGDIGTVTRKPGLIKRYFEQIHQVTDHVIWVLGNHEFYHGEYNQVIDNAARLADDMSVKLLDEAINTQEVVIDDVTFWGSTLWTDLRGNDWLVSTKIENGFNDFYCVTKDDRTFRAADTVEINSRTREKINWNADVIITHHSPILRPHRRFATDDITYGFCNTGLDEQIVDSHVKYWLYGHTHDSRVDDLNNTIVLSNQQGYPRRIGPSSEIIYEDDLFNPGLLIEI